VRPEAAAPVFVCLRRSPRPRTATWDVCPAVQPVHPPNPLSRSHGVTRVSGTHSLADTGDAAERDEASDPGLLDELGHHLARAVARGSRHCRRLAGSGAILGPSGLATGTSRVSCLQSDEWVMVGLGQDADKRTDPQRTMGYEPDGGTAALSVGDGPHSRYSVHG
jgi:hypothetical protein